MAEAPVSSRRNAPALAAWILLCFVPAVVGAFSRPGDWYASLNKPAWNPPSWIFGPVWTTLYLLMGIAAWRVWRRGGFAAQACPLRLFLLQLAVNALWTPVFFGLQQIGPALAVLLTLVALVSLTVHAFLRVDRPAALMLTPYLGWGLFAAVLNATLWMMNR